MTHIFDFLKSWTPINRKLFWFFVVLAGMVLVPYFWGMYNSVAYVYPIETLYEIETVNHVLDNFDHLGLSMDINGNSFMLTGLYSGGEIQFPMYLYYGLMVVIWLAVSGIFSAITYFKLWPYNISMLIVTMIIVLMRLDILNIPFLSGQLFFGALVLSFAGLSFYFFAFGYKRPFWQRFLGFSLLCAVWALVIGFGAQTPKSAFVLLAHYQIVVPMALAMLFIIMNGYDVPALLLKVITDTRQLSTRRAMIDNTLLNVLYLGNVILIYLHNSNRVSWDLLYINPFYLVIISGAVGLWNWRSRFERLAWITESSHALTFLYVALYVGALSGLAFILSSSNDPMIEVFEDFISIGYFSIGAAFYLYTLLNFIDIPNHVKLGSVMYQPKHMSLLAVPIIGLTGMMIWFYQANKYQIKQAYCGYYNSLGDAYYELKDYHAAKGFYQEAFTNVNYNHRSNFGIGAAEYKLNQFEQASNSFSRACYKQQNPATYLAISKIQLALENPMSAIYALEEARGKQWKNDPKILVSLAYLYGKSAVKDSIAVFENYVGQYAAKDEVAHLNSIYYRYKQQVKISKEELATASLSNNEAIRANVLAYKNVQGEADSSTVVPTYILADTALTSQRLLLYYNTAINKAMQGDTSIAPGLRKLIASAKNESNLSFIQFALGYSLYRGGNASEGLRILGLLEDNKGGSSSYYTNLFGQLLFKEGAFLRAEDLFKEYSRLIQSEAFVLQTLCLSESKFKDETKENWLSIIKYAKPEDEDGSKALASSALLMMNQGALPKEGVNYSDFQVRYFLAQQGSSLPVDVLVAWQSRIKDASQQVYSAAQLVDVARRQNQAQIGLKIFSEKINLSGASKASKAALVLAGLKLYSAMGNTKAIAELIAQEKTLPVEGYQLHTFKAELAGLDSVKAIPLWKKALAAQPLDAYTVIKAASFYNSIGKQEAAYSIILQGLDDNIYQPEILKAYVIQCYALHLDSFAADGLQRIKNVLPQSEYELFASKLSASEIRP